MLLNYWRQKFYNIGRSLQSCQSGFSTLSKASKHSTSGISSGVSSNHSEKNLVLTLLNSFIALDGNKLERFSPTSSF